MTYLWSVSPPSHSAFCSVLYGLVRIHQLLLPLKCCHTALLIRLHKSNEWKVGFDSCYNKSAGIYVVTQKDRIPNRYIFHSALWNPESRLESSNVFCTCLNLVVWLMVQHLFRRQLMEWVHSRNEYKQQRFMCHLKMQLGLPRLLFWHKNKPKQDFFSIMSVLILTSMSDGS